MKKRTAKQQKANSEELQRKIAAMLDGADLNYNDRGVKKAVIDAVLIKESKMLRTEARKHVNILYSGMTIPKQTPCSAYEQAKHIEALAEEYDLKLPDEFPLLKSKYARGCLLSYLNYNEYLEKHPST